MTHSLPLLLLDVDGVLNPFAAPGCPPGYQEYEFFPGEEPVRLCAAHGPWLQELATRFQIVTSPSLPPDRRRFPLWPRTSYPGPHVVQVKPKSPLIGL